MCPGIDYSGDGEILLSLVTPPRWLSGNVAVVVVVLGCLLACLLAYRPWQHASVSKGLICSDNCTCCHTETEALDHFFCLTKSHYVLTPSQPVPALTLQCQAPGRAATVLERLGTVPRNLGVTGTMSFRYSMSKNLLTDIHHVQTNQRML